MRGPLASGINQCGLARKSESKQSHKFYKKEKGLTILKFVEPTLEFLPCLQSNCRELILMCTMTSMQLGKDLIIWG